MVGYEVRDPGPVTFSTAGTKTFRFSITAEILIAAAMSSFAITLISIHFEAETSAGRGALRANVTIHDRNPSGGSARLLKATRLGDYVTYGVPIAEPGNYNIRVKTNTGSNIGIFRLFIDGVKQGYAQKRDENQLNQWL